VLVPGTVNAKLSDNVSFFIHETGSKINKVNNYRKLKRKQRKFGCMNFIAGYTWLTSQIAAERYHQHH